MSSELSVKTYSDIQKRHSDIDFAETLHSFVNNLQWGNGYLARNHVSNKGYIWNCLSAIGNKIGADISENVINYIDNVSNIDTCHVKALQSMCKQYGIDYTILNIDNMPIEVVRLMDILSMNKTYLLEAEHTRLLEASRAKLENDVTYKFDYYNSEFFNADYVDGDISICLSGASSTRVDKDFANSYLLFRDQAYDTPRTPQQIIDELSSLGEFEDYMLSDDLSASRFTDGYFKLFTDESRLKILPTWLSAFTFSYVKFKELSNGLSSFYDVFADHSYQIQPTDVIYPEDPLAQISCIEDLYEYEGCLSTIIERNDEESDIVKFQRTYIGKKTKNHLYQVNFIPTRSSTLVQYRKYIYNTPVSFWIVMDPGETRIICSSNSRLDSTRDNCTFYVPMLFGNEPYVYNGVRISPDEFIDDVFLQSSIYFFNLEKKTAGWKYALTQQPEINLYNIGVVNVETTFYPDREVRRNSTTTVDPDRYRECLEGAFFSLLSTMCNLEYLDDRLEHKEIYKNLGESQLTLESLMNVSRNETEDFIAVKNMYRVPLKFNEVVAVNNIDAGISAMSDYSENEQHVIELEISRRATASNVLQNVTRYYYYREAKVKEYFKYIQHLYGDKYVLSNSIYAADDNYFEVQPLLSSDYEAMRLAHDVENEGVTETQINYDVMHGAAQILTDMALNIAEIREKLKMTSQKYYMRGSYELLAYAINEYLLNNIKVNYDELSSVANEFADVNLIEYIDNTEYFNIKQNLEKYANIKYQEYENNRYFENTLFEELYMKSHSSFEYDKSSALGAAAISSYYNNIQKIGMPTIEKTEKFLNTVYNTGATYSHIDGNLNTIAHSPNLDSGVVWDNKKEALDVLYRLYSGNEFGDDPVYNAKNKTFSSYQIHPFLYNFVEYVDHVFPIENYYHKYMPKDYAQRVAENIDKYIGIYGEVKFLWLTDTFDFTGYSSRFEIETNQSQTNPDNHSQFADRDGLFIDEFISIMFSSSSNVEQDEASQYIISEWQKQYDDTVASFLTHLNISDYEKQLVSRRFSFYRQLIKDMAVDNPELYDIYKYAVDVNGNVLALVKRYPTPVSETSEEVKRNTRGTLWVRIKDYPCAFPAFNIDFGTVQKHGKLIHKFTNPNNIYEPLLTETNSVFYSPTRTLNKELMTDFGSGFYDMELDARRQYLLLTYTPSSIIGHPEVHTSKNVNVMIGKLTKDYDYTNMLYRFSYAITDECIIASISNDDPREKVEDYAYNEFVGFVRYPDSVGACYAQKYVNPETQEDTLKENYHWQSNIIKVNNDFAPYTLTYGIDLQIKLFAYEPELYVYKCTVSDLKYNICKDNNICLSYADDKFVLAFESAPIATNSLVTNYVEFDYNNFIDSTGALVSAYDGSISATELSDLTKHQLVNWPYVTEDFNLGSNSENETLLKNTFDSFDKYVVAIEYSFEHEDIEHVKTTYYNINSDMSYLPLFASEGGVERLWNNANLSGNAEHKMQILGYSGTYYSSSDTDTQSYDIQSEIAKATTKKSAALEDPFPYYTNLSIEPIGPNRNTGKGYGYLPFDVYDRLEPYSLDERLTASIDTDRYGNMFVMFNSGTEQITSFVSADVVFTRKESSRLLGPYILPTSNTETIPLPVTYVADLRASAIGYSERGLSATDSNVFITTPAVQEISESDFIKKIQNQKALLHSTELSGLSSEAVLVGNSQIPLSSCQLLDTELALSVPALSVKIDSIGPTAQQLTITDAIHPDVVCPSLSVLNQLLSPISAVLSSGELTSSISKDTDGNILSNGVKLEVELSTLLNEGDIACFPTYTYAAGTSSLSVQAPLSTVLYCKTTTLLSCVLDIYKLSCCVSYDNFATSQVLARNVFSDIRFRTGKLVRYYNCLNSYKQTCYNLIYDDTVPFNRHQYPNASLAEDVKVAKFYNWNNLENIVLCERCFMHRQLGANDYWTKVNLDFTPVDAFSDLDQQKLILKTVNGTLYSAVFDDLIQGKATMQQVNHSSQTALSTETYVFQVPDDLSSYSLTIKNTSNNVTLYSRPAAGTAVNNYKYDGDIQPEYEYNDGKIYKSSYSIGRIKNLTCKEDQSTLSVSIEYAPETYSINSGLMTLEIFDNRADTRNYDRYHLFTLKPLTTDQFKQQLKQIDADTPLSSVSMFANKQVAFKYSATAMNTKEDYPILED